MPLALAFRRFPGPTIALAGVSVATMVVATITHPLIGYETETVTWARYLRQGFFQPTIATAYGAGRGWGACCRSSSARCRGRRWPRLCQRGACA